VPEAVIEIVSPGYTEQDLSINPPWYLSQGVKDVLIGSTGGVRALHAPCASTATAP
jgi:hypothetical protein